MTIELDKIIRENDALYSLKDADSVKTSGGINQFEDLELIREIKSSKIKKQSLFFLLVEKYQERLFRLATLIIGNSIDAEDALQNAFISAFQSIDNFQERSSFYTWIYRIVINKSKDMKSGLKKNKEKFIEGSELEINDQRLNIQGDVERQEQSEFLFKKISLLKNIYREILILRYFEELSYQDIAEILGINIGTVKSRIHKAKASLKRLILKDKKGSSMLDTHFMEK
jgi:RNA polymerase sigma-70 factor (ECF subfamily)